MAPGDYAGLQANRPRRSYSGTRSFFIAFSAEPEFLYLYATFRFCFLVKRHFRIFSLRVKIPSAFSPCAEKDPAGVPAPGAGGRKGEDLPSPAQRGRRPEPAQGDMRMVLVVPFAIKRYRLKKPVLEGERNRIPNPPPFCAPIQKAAKLATGTVAILSKGPSFAKKVHSIIMSILTYTRATQMAHFLVLR